MTGDEGPTRLGAALLVPGGPLGQRFLHVLRVIDGVQRVGSLPRIPIELGSPAPGVDGRYRYRKRDGKALGIVVSPAAPTPELTRLHEIGLFLDQQGLGDPGRFAAPRHPDLEAWRMATISSHACAGLREARRFAALSGQAVHDLEYLLDPCERWARSYAQFVTSRSGDPLLARQLAATRRAPAPYHLAYWWDDEFEAIAATIDDLLRRRGWLR